MILGRASAPKKALIDMITGAVAFVWLVPFLTMLLTAVKPTDEIYASAFSWVPHGFTLEHFSNAWKAAPFAHYYLNSCIVACGTTVLTLLIASMAAFALCRLSFPGRRFLLLGVLAPTMVPFQVLLIPYFILLTALGLVNSILGLIVAYLAIFLPFSIFILAGFMRHLPREVEESARVDGCSWFGIWWRTCVPMSRPALAAVGIYTFVESWKEFFVALVLTTGQTARTVPVGLALFRTDAPGVSWGEIMASAVTSSLPAVLVFLLLQRHFISGLTQGAVKG